LTIASTLMVVRTPVKTLITGHELSGGAIGMHYYIILHGITASSSKE